MIHAGDKIKKRTTADSLYLISAAQLSTVQCTHFKFCDRVFTQSRNCYVMHQSFASTPPPPTYGDSGEIASLWCSASTFWLSPQIPSVTSPYIYWVGDNMYWPNHESMTEPCAIKCWFAKYFFFIFWAKFIVFGVVYWGICFTFSLDVCRRFDSKYFKIISKSDWMIAIWVKSSKIWPYFHCS